MLRRALAETLEIVKELVTGIADLYRLTHLISLESAVSDQKHLFLGVQEWSSLA